jgi:SAM-dependent methyltransferase
MNQTHYKRIEQEIKYTDKEGFYGTPFRFWINQNLRSWISEYCPLDNSEILEVGCGEGEVKNVFKQLGIRGNYFGIDIRESQNWANINNNGRLKVNFILQDAHALSSLKKSFNFCISVTSFEHFFDDGKVLAEIKKVLEPGAIFILIVPSKYSYWLYGRHGYCRYSKKSIAELAKKHRFQVIELKKIGGVFGFLSHFLWSSLSRTLRIIGKSIYYTKIINTATFYYKVDNIMHFHLNHAQGRKFHKGLQIFAYKLDQKFTFLESGYCVVLKNILNISQ